MALTIKWTKQAELSFANIIDYLGNNFTEREIKNFISKSNSVIAQISVTPLMFIHSGKKQNISEAVIAPQCLLIYRIEKKHIDLLAFFDTRQHPKKKPKR